MEKRSNFFSFPQYFQFISNFKSPVTHIRSYVLNVVVRIIFSSILQIWYVEVRISESISGSPLEFEITRVDCISWSISKKNVANLGGSRTRDLLVSSRTRIQLMVQLVRWSDGPKLAVLLCSYEFIAGIYFVFICFSSLLLFVPREGRDCDISCIPSLIFYW